MVEGLVLSVVQRDGAGHVLHRTDMMRATRALELYDQLTRSHFGVATVLEYESGNVVRDVDGLRKAVSEYREYEAQKSYGGIFEGKYWADRKIKLKILKENAAKYGRGGPWPIFICSFDFDQLFGHVKYSPPNSADEEFDIYEVPVSVAFDVDSSDQDHAQISRSLREVGGNLDALQVTAQRKVYPLSFERAPSDCRLLLPLARHDLWSVLRDRRFFRESDFDIVRWNDISVLELDVLRAVDMGRGLKIEDVTASILESLVNNDLLKKVNANYSMTGKGENLFQEANQRRG